MAEGGVDCRGGRVIGKGKISRRKPFVKSLLLQLSPVGSISYLIDYNACSESHFNLISQFCITYLLSDSYNYTL